MRPLPNSAAPSGPEKLSADCSISVRNWDEFMWPNFPTRPENMGGRHGSTNSKSVEVCQSILSAGAQHEIKNEAGRCDYANMTHLRLRSIDGVAAWRAATLITDCPKLL